MWFKGYAVCGLRSFCGGSGFRGFFCFGLSGMGSWIDRGLVWFRVLREMEVMMNVRMRLSTWATDSRFRRLQCIL